MNVSSDSTSFRLEKNVISGFFLVSLMAITLSCGRSPSDSEKEDGKDKSTAKQPAQPDLSARDSDKDRPKQDSDSNTGHAGFENLAEVLVGSWKTTFVVDDDAFDSFVEDNMLPEDLADSEKARWNESSIRIEFNSDGSCIYTEPDGNHHNAYWDVSKAVGNRGSVTITASQTTWKASVVMDDERDEFTCEFVDDDQYDLLPIKKPLAFTRE